MGAAIIRCAALSPCTGETEEAAAVNGQPPVTLQSSPLRNIASSPHQCIKLHSRTEDKSFMDENLGEKSPSSS